MEVAVPVIRVSEAIQFCNTLFSEVELWVEGEVANYTVSRGKFVFFDLKDEQEEARLNCFMMLYQQNIPLEDGMRITVQARPSIFAKNGKFSLTVRRLEAKGEGSVRRAFELLKQKLEKEGLFAVERKRPLPRFVSRVGIISSGDAAGYSDFMRIIESRLSGVHFLFMDVAVQGKDAESEICHAFDYLNSHYELDAVVLIRGGGSMEDLHAFNSELVARAIARSKAPVLAGIGHERDTTIADFCADLRASTPSNAAQLLLPTVEEVSNLVSRLTFAGQEAVGQFITRQRLEVAHHLGSIKSSSQFFITTKRNQVESLLKTIRVTSPLETLKRGYSITKDSKGKVLRSAKKVKKGDVLTTILYDGQFHSTHS